MNVKQTIESLVRMPIAISVMLKGRHGIGKSMVVKQAADILKVPCVDFRLSQNDVGDLKGMPFHVNGRTVFAPPEFFPLTKEDADDLKKLLNLAADISLGRYGDKGILFLDEINRANREVQQAAFELVLDRRMNLRKLPDGWRVVTAVNDDDDVYSVNALDPAFLSRFFLIDFQPSYEEWIAWAEKEDLHPSIIEFIRRYPDFLDPSPAILKEASSSGVKKVHDRRSWHRFSMTLNSMVAESDAGTYGDPLSKEPGPLNYLTLIAEGFVGHLAGVKFRSFIETDYKALDAATILNKWTDEIAKHVKKLADGGKVPELSTYNEALVGHIKKSGKMTPTQRKNLASYMELLPNELVADIWQKMNHEIKALAEEWYQSDKARHSALVLRAMVNPKTAAGAAKKV